MLRLQEIGSQLECQYRESQLLNINESIFWSTQLLNIGSGLAPASIATAPAIKQPFIAEFYLDKNWLDLYAIDKVNFDLSSQTTEQFFIDIKFIGSLTYFRIAEESVYRMLNVPQRHWPAMRGIFLDAGRFVYRRRDAGPVGGSWSNELLFYMFRTCNFVKNRIRFVQLCVNSPWMEVEPLEWKRHAH